MMTGRGSLLLGVDGGNTKTIALIAAPDGEILAAARGGNSDIYACESPEAAIGEICRLVGDALAAAGVHARALRGSAFSLAGADWPEDFELLEAQLTRRLGLVHRPQIVNDSLGALRSGAPSWEGIAVACGTFNAIGARNRDGRSFHLGFWPDQRGGHDLGLAALKAVYRQGFDLGPATSLTGRVLELFRAPDAGALLHAFTRRDERISAKELGRLAPVLLDEADRGDAVAHAIVVEAGAILGRQARVCAQRVGLEIVGVNVVLTGGVLAHPTTRLAEAIMACLPGAVPRRTSAPPVTGALLLAFDAAGLPMSADRLSGGVAAVLAPGG